MYLFPVFDCAEPLDAFETQMYFWPPLIFADSRSAGFSTPPHSGTRLCLSGCVTSLFDWDSRTMARRANPRKCSRWQIRSVMPKLQLGWGIITQFSHYYNTFFKVKILIVTMRACFGHAVLKILSSKPHVIFFFLGVLFFSCPTVTVDNLFLIAPVWA